MLTDIKTFISNIGIVIPDIGSYFNQYCDKSFYPQTLANCYFKRVHF